MCKECNKKRLEYLNRLDSPKNTVLANIMFYAQERAGETNINTVMTKN